MSNHPQPNPTDPRPAPSQRGRARKRRESGLYLPLWSILLMLFSVCGITIGAVWLILNSGSVQQREQVNEQGTVIAPTQPEPLIIISSPVGLDALLSPMTATLPPEFESPAVQNLFQVPANYQFAGPVLPTVYISPTPMMIAIGSLVQVSGVGEQDLNVRDSAGVFGTNVIFRAPLSSRFMIVGGPEQQDNLTWWQIQDVNDSSRVGWASGQYLVAIPN